MIKNSFAAIGFAFLTVVEVSAVTGDDLQANGDTECWWFKAGSSANAAKVDTGAALQAETDEDSKNVIITYPAPGTSFRDRLRSGAEGPEMVVIPAGRFRMGCVSGIDCSDNEKPVHEVEIARPFALSKYEITFKDYDQFTYPFRMDPHDLGDHGWHPVFNVMWDCANEYAAWLSEQTGKRYRLPTEAEWEYAARAGSKTAYFWGNDIGQNQANCYVDCGDRWQATAPVGSFAANAWGLHDMHGNVYEWVQDCWNDSYVGAPTDGSAWMSGDCDRRVVRGGSFHFLSIGVRSAFRDEDPRAYRYNFQGFRLARDL